MKFYDELKWRGLIKDVSSDDLEEKINAGGMTFYWGTDPTADSMHLGHFSSLLMAKRLEMAGHHPIILVGGATGMIGDPRPTTERAMISKEEVKKNFEGIKKQIEDLFGYEVVNNYDWSKEINFIDFLRDYGKYFNVNYMLDKDIIKRRLDTGITYTEFSYMIMQALDFEYLYRTKGCVMQAAGQDQWGNITAGVELIRKKLGKEAYAFTMPLVTDKAGKKFGKSEGNALWLDRNKTSSYELYQFLVNVEDEMVIDYLKIYTFLSKEEIEKIEAEHKLHPELRLAHKTLAKEIITFLHGEEGYQEALRITDALFCGDTRNLTNHDIEIAFKGFPTDTLKEEENIVDFLVNHGIVSSKREAREFIGNGSITINGQKVTDLEFIVSKSVALGQKYVITRRGKKKYYVAVFED